MMRKQLAGKISVTTLLFSLFSQVMLAQPGNGRSSAEGSIYGKVLDSESKKPLEFAVVQLFSIGPDSSKKLVSGALTEHNGDFRMDKVPVGMAYILQINMIGYESYEGSAVLSKGGNGVLKDAGNIFLQPSMTLSEVIIEGETQAFRLEFDKRIYDVDKNPINEGGTAEDVLQNIPGLNVDLDGNVSMRNASPQIFVDGRPTNLTIDQIPADAILRVEVITNPSSKFDASGGGGGIVNIVMKKNRSMGYNGSLRAGIDRRQRINGGLDFNLREGKFNFFGGANYNERRRISVGTTTRRYYGATESQMDQTQNNVNDGYHMRFNFGVDWFADNRNTFTLNPSFNRGVFEPRDSMQVITDTLTTGSDQNGMYWRESATFRQFENLGSSLLYKHLFHEEGDELTADLSLNRITSEFTGDYSNRYSSSAPSEQRQTGNVSQWLGVAQIDYVNVIGENTKLEVGMRGSVRDYSSEYANYNSDQETGELVRIKQLNVNYHYLDQVYAGYTTMNRKWNKWQFQVGLRAESSNYRAELTDTTLSFSYIYPLSLFPSLNVTKAFSDKQDVQFIFNRRISRPSFHSLSPFTDYSDSLNVSRGNPGLKPEFTYSAELSYQLSPNKKNTFIASLFGRHTTDVTVNQLVSEYSPVLDRTIVVSTFDNAASSSATGIELISTNKLADWFELTTNVNFFWSYIDGRNLETSLTNSRSSWWAKVNATFRLPYSFTLQTTADYAGRKSLDSGSTSRGGGIGNDGGGRWDMSANTVQGYVDPVYGVDFSLKKDFFKDRRLSVSFSIRDAFRTRITVTHSESVFFVQDSFRRRDPQLWRINVSWKFGKTDSSLFRRKNMGQGGESMEG